MSSVPVPVIHTPRVVRFDARPLLAAGAEPLSRILESASSLADGDCFELIAPFEPVPLYDVMRTRGFRVEGCTPDDESGAYLTRFTRVEIAAEHTVGSVLARYPATRAALARHSLDTCCGAHLSVQQAADSQGVALPSLLAELTADAVR